MTAPPAGIHPGGEDSTASAARRPGFHRLAAALLSICLASRPAAAQAPGIYDHAGNWRNPGQVILDEEELRFIEGRAPYFRSESIFFTGLLDNGWVFTVCFSAWTYSFFRGWGVIAALADPSGQNHWFQKEVDRHTLSIARDRLSIRFEGGLIEGRPPEYRIRLEDVGGFSCDLAIHNLLPAWKPGDGYAWLTDEKDVYTHFRIPVPWGRVRGTLGLAGRRMPVQGECYADQSTQVAPPRRMSSPAVALRLFSPPGEPAGSGWFLDLFETASHPAYGRQRQSMLLLAARRESLADWVLTTPRFDLDLEGFTQEGEIPDEYPTLYRLQVEERGYRLEGECRLDRLYNLTDILADLPPFLRAIADALIRRPVIFRGVGEFHGTLSLPGGEVRRLRLQGPVEYMIFR